MDLATAYLAGTALNVGGSLLGGSGGDGIDVSENYRLNKALTAARIEDMEALYGEHFQETSKAAKAAGYHPLYALGKSPQHSQSVIAGQAASGSKWADALGAAGSGLTGYAEAKAAKPLRDAQTGLTTMQAEEARARTEAQDFETAVKKADYIKRMEAEAAAAKAKQDTDSRPGYVPPWASERDPRGRPSGFAGTVDSAYQYVMELYDEINKALGLDGPSAPLNIRINQDSSHYPIRR